MESNQYFRRKDIKVIYEDDPQESEEKTEKKIEHLKSSKTSFYKIYAILRLDESKDFFYLRSLNELEFELFKVRIENLNDFSKALLSPTIAMAVLLNAVIAFGGLQYAQIIKLVFSDSQLSVQEIERITIAIFMCLGLIVILKSLIRYRHSNSILMIAKRFTTIKEYEKKKQTTKNK